MDQEPKTEAEAKEKLQRLKDTPREKLERPDQVVSWLVSSANRFETLFPAASAIVTDVVLKNSLSVELTLKVLDFYKKHPHRCKGECAPHFVIVGIAACAQCHDELSTTSEALLAAIRPYIYLSESTLASSIESIKEVIVPKMKALAEGNQYSEALSMWRSIVKFTRFEKIPTSVTNRILHVATMAFKETNPVIHIDAFNSWKIFIERLPELTIRKANYVSLLLNPLNRVYRETDSKTNAHKFSVWWQLVRSLRGHAEPNFDQVVVPLIQKVFCLSRSQQSKSLDVDQETLEVSSEAYALLALLLYMGNNDILKEMNALHEMLPVNQHVFKDAHFAKHSALMREVVELVVHNIVEGVSQAPLEIYPYLLLKILISRASSLFVSESVWLSQVFMSCAIKLVRTSKLDAEQSLGVFSDLANGAPQKLMMTSHFVPDFGETLIAHLTVYFIQRVSSTCSHGTDNQKKRFRGLLRVLLERASSDFLPFTDHVISNSLSLGNVFEVPVWTELVERLTEVIARTHEVSQPSSESEHNFSAVIKCLRFPFERAWRLTSETIKLWCKLFTVFAANAILVKDLAPNQHIEEVCRVLYGELALVENNLHRLMLYSQALESVVKQITPEVASESNGNGKKKKSTFGNLESFVKCLAFVAKKSFQFISDEKQSKSDCQFFVNVVSVFHHLLRATQDLRLYRELCNELLPDLVPLYESTKSRNIIRETCLNHVEAPLTNILGQLSEELVSKAPSLAEDPDFAKNMKTVLSVATGHWKRSIRDTFIAYANSISVPVGDGELSSQSLSQFVSVSDAVPLVGSKGAPIFQEKAATPVVKRRSSRAKNGKATENDDFTPIKSAKKKSIFTEHQLEKQAESKVIPSMYEDLSQSVDKVSTQPIIESVDLNSTVTSNAPIEDENANFEVALNGMPNGEPAIQEPAPAVDDKDIEETLKLNTGAPADNIDIEGIRPIESPDQVQPVLPPAETVNNENDEPVAKKKKRFSYNENDEMPDPVLIDQQPSSLVRMAEKIQQQQLLDKGEVESAMTESPMRNFQPRKRKIGQSFESPILSRMSPKSGFLVNSPSSRSRKMLEAAQAKQGGQTDIRHMLAGSTPRHNNCFTVVDHLPQMQQALVEERRLTLSAANAAMSSPASARRSILKRFSTGVSAKRVSFSRSNEVCAFLKNRTAKSLFPPVTVNDEENNVNEKEEDASPRVDLCEKSFHEDLDESIENVENDGCTNASFSASVNNSVRLELGTDDDNDEEENPDSSVRKILFEEANVESTAAAAAAATATEDVDGPEAESNVEDVKLDDPVTEGPDPKEAEDEAVSDAEQLVGAESSSSLQPAPPQVNLVKLIKEAEGEQRKEVLAHVSSHEFLAKMTTHERNAFAIRVFASIGFYVQ